VVISGTGTIAVGRDAAGRHHRCGGWGWLLDGAGSALDIGRDGLALSLQMADGRHPPGPLGPALWQALQLAWGDPLAPQALKALVVGPAFGPAGFARLAPVVEQQAASGDADAGRILEHSAQALAAMVAGVAGALGLEAPAVGAMGGALTHLAQFRRRLEQALARQLPAARLSPAAGDACSGALSLAQGLLDAPAAAN
jgi:N-acetylglucosamine kinase-like BadF-type ATPase